MKKILIPVDFSDYSQSAIAYAAQISNQQGQEIDLVHIFTNHTNIYANRVVNPDLVDPEVDVAKKNMARLLESEQAKYAEVTFHTFYKDGNLYEEVSKMTAAFQYDAVIMGTKGSAGLEAVFLGSNTYDVILNSKTPVLAVPKESPRFKVNRVGLLCNFKEAELHVLNQAINLIGKDFELILVHVNKDDKDIRIIHNQFKEWIDKIIEQTGIENISYTVKPQVLYNRAAENISHAIDAVIADEQIDLLLVTKSRKSIFRKLVDENIVRKLAYATSIPKFFARVLPVK